MSQRLHHIDIAKGLLIILVMIMHHPEAHNAAESVLAPVIAPPIIPMFFLLSGIFFRPHEPFPQMIRSRVDSLLKPYFVTLALVGALIYLVADWIPFLSSVRPVHGVDPGQYVFGMLYGVMGTVQWGPLWFLPHLFVVFVLSWAILRFSPLEKCPAWLQLAVLGAMHTLGVLALPLTYQQPVTLFGAPVPVFGEGSLLPGLPWSIDLAPMNASFFLLGYLFREPLKQMRFNGIGLAVALALGSVLVFSGQTRLDPANRQYAHLFYPAALAFVGIYVVLAASDLLARLNRARVVFTYLGANTLLILIFHFYPVGKFAQVLAAKDAPLPVIWVASLLGGLLVALIAAEIVHRMKFLRIAFEPLPKTPKVAVAKTANTAAV